MSITTQNIHLSLDALASETQGISNLLHDNTIDQTPYFLSIYEEIKAIRIINATYLPFLRYLARLDDIANKMAEGALSPTTPPEHTVWPTPEEGLTFKCRLANLIWQDLRGITNDLSLGNLVTVAEENGVLAASELVGAIMLKFPLTSPAGGAFLFFILILNVLKTLEISPWAALLDKIDDGKADFIMACYNADDAQTAHDDAIASLGELSVFESLHIRQVLPVGTFEHLFIEGNYPMPDNPVICAETEGFFGIPDECASVEESEYTGDDDNPPTWKTASGGVIIDTWHTFHRISGESGAFFRLSGRFHVLLNVSQCDDDYPSILYTPGNGNCGYSEILDLVIGETYIFDCTLFSLNTHSSFDGATYTVRFNSAPEEPPA
jgi:hypothetical protein